MASILDKPTWFCRSCWRCGDFEYTEATIENAAVWHKAEVERDKAASKIPAGMDPRCRNSPSMMRLPAEDCDGDLILRPARKRGAKEKPPAPPDLIFEGEPLKF